MNSKSAKLIYKALMGFVVTTMAFSANAEDSTAELAKKLSNPIATLISVPIQANYDEKYNVTDDGERYVYNIQPVIPITVNDDWNVISRTILPIINQNNIPSGESNSGVGDVLQSVFFSPKAPTADGWIWGVGPVLLLPTASDKLLGGEKWGAGPTAVVLRQSHGWTYGGLANHVSSFSGKDHRADISSTYLQPFFSYTTATYTTFGLNIESTYDWKADEWSVPVNLTVAQLFKVGGQPMQIQLGLRYWADTTRNGPEGIGFRLGYTLLFPR